jgi:trimeric autotransporter adhesin
MGPLQDNGGPTETESLLAGNPAISLIPNPTTGFCPTTDQRGDQSPTGESCDSGSVQLSYSATTLYAAPSAQGSADCTTPANACSLGTALSVVYAGGTIELTTSGVEGTSSTYYSGGFDFDTSGTSSSSPVTIEPMNGVNDPILDGGGTSTVLTIEDAGYLDLSGVTLQDGQGTFGGAIDNGDGGTITIDASTFSGNNAKNGGAIDNGQQFLSNTGQGNVTVTDSTFSDNTAVANGGAIDNGDGGGGGGTVTVSDSTFSGNSAPDGDGGAIDNGDDGSGTLTVSDSTFTGNPARDGGTIDNGDTGGSGTVYVGADIFDGSCDQAGGSWTDKGYNLGTNGSCHSGGTGDITDAGLTLPGLADNGGPTQTILPALGSPAIGKIPTGTTLNGVHVCSRHDQRGVASYGKCTIGAVEGGFLITTTSLPKASPGKHYHPVHLTTQEAGSHATLSWTKVKLPSGTTLSKAGVLSGTPSKSLKAGRTSIKVKVTETVGKTKTTVEATIPLTIT